MKAIGWMILQMVEEFIHIAVKIIIIILKEGARYDGEWKNDLQNGYGIESWPDGA